MKHKIDQIPDLTSADLDFKACRKLPVIVYAVQVPHTFTTTTLEGETALGRAGDYLMIGVKGERYPCAKEIFEQTYRFVEP